VTRWILATDGQPFRDRDAADIKRDLLLSELGPSVQLDVIHHPGGGFAVSVVPSASTGPEVKTALESPREVLERSLGQTRTRSAPSGSDSSEDASELAPAALTEGTPYEHYPESFQLSPAPRAFVGLHLQALLGSALVLQPHWVWIATGLGAPKNPTLDALMLVAIALSGALLALHAVSRFLWAHTANTYLIDRTGVEQREWYFDRGRLRRRAPRIQFAHLRTVDVDQSVLQMLLNVGTLKLAAGATDTYEVVLKLVRAPRALQREFQRRLQEAGAPHQTIRAKADL
jgi:hypothetical protein